MVEQTEWRLCLFCNTEPSSPCEDDCPSRNPQLRGIISHVRELLFTTEFLYKRVAVDMSTSERLEIEQTINSVFAALGGVKN